jgi:uncharacterized protein
MTTTSLQASRGLLLKAARSFYRKHSDLIKESHGIVHAEKVYHHACNAIESLSNSTSTTTKRRNHRTLSQDETLEIEAAALLHDVDDDKYFPKSKKGGTTIDTKDNGKDGHELEQEHERREDYASLYPNAVELMKESRIPESSHEKILFMIDAVSCSKNGNSVPERVDEQRDSGDNTINGNGNANANANYHLLIPRWSDRIEAVGARGVWRCYQYNQEKKRPLDLPGVTPRPQSSEELWSQHVVPERFEAYMVTQDGKTEDPSMLGHYYDKLFHVACPPSDIVRNDYLEEKLGDSAKELVEVCLRYGKTGIVDEDYIKSFRDT